MKTADVKQMAVLLGKLKSHNELLLAGCQEWKRLHAQNAETIAEQQREIVSLQMQLHAVRAWLKNVAEHTRECEHERWNQPLCTCGLDEVLK